LLPAPGIVMLPGDALPSLLAVELACATAFELLARPGKVGRPAAVTASPAGLGLLQCTSLYERVTFGCFCISESHLLVDRAGAA
jgi:hypothetical protein